LKDIPFRHIGGAVVADHGGLTLTSARGLARFYRSESDHWSASGAADLALACMRRSTALLDAVARAETWRRAAGWVDPEDADL
jgi:hypothetical protein